MQLSDFQQNVPLAPFTTLNIGGPAQYFAIATKQSELFEILKFVTKSIEDCSLKIEDFHLLGIGSNTLISDLGLPGLTIINRARQIKIHPRLHPGSTDFKVTNTQRHENEPEIYLDFTKLDYDETYLPYQEVTIQSGTPLPYAINETIASGLTGLQWFAYIPGSIGGAVYQNIHGGRYHFSDYLVSIKTFNLKTGKTQIFKKESLSWSYETSFFQQNPHLIILSATLKLFRGDTATAQKVSQAWIAQKSKVQPMNSPGSAFANPSLEHCLAKWGEQKSAGWIIDHELNLKEFSIGDAQISPQHSNFFINRGHATATDYKKLIDYVQSAVYDKFKIKLIPEIKFLGKFD